MTDQIQPGNTNGHGSYEHQDLKVSGIVYFLVSLIIVTVICMFGLQAFYYFLEHHERSTQEPVNPLVKKVPEDTRSVAAGYPEAAFPNPRLEINERGQLDDILARQDQALYSYGWVDEKAGTVRIPIDRAMDLLVERGLPVLPQGAKNESSGAAAQNNQRANAARAVKGTKGTKK